MALLGTIAGESSLSSGVGRWRQHVSSILSGGSFSGISSLDLLKAASGEISLSSSYGRWAVDLSLAIDNRNISAVRAALNTTHGERGFSATLQWDRTMSTLLEKLSLPYESSWSEGYWLDFRPRSGVYTAPLTPDVGTHDFTPINSPSVDLVGMGGRGAIFCDKSLVQYLAAHNYAALQVGSNLDCTQFMRVQRLTATGTNSPFGFGNSGDSTHNYWSGQFPGGAALSPTSNRKGPAELTEQVVSNSVAMDYADHVVAWVMRGGVGEIWFGGPGQPLALVASGPLATVALSPNRYALGARFTTAPLGHLGGWIACTGLTPRALTPSELATMYAYVMHGDLKSPGKGDGALVQCFGDSIMQSGAGGGWRSRMYEWWRARRQNLTLVGHHNQGYFANPQHSATGGLNTLSIRSEILAHVTTYRPDVLAVMHGTNDTDDVEGGGLPIGTWSGYTDLLLDSARSELNKLPNGQSRQIVVYTILPQKAGNLGAAAVDPMNIVLRDRWDAHDAANPNSPPVIRVDAHAAVGGAWSAPLYLNGTDPVHPNDDGDALIGADTNAACSTLWASKAA